MKAFRKKQIKFYKNTLKLDFGGQNHIIVNNMGRYMSIRSVLSQKFKVIQKIQKGFVLKLKTSIFRCCVRLCKIEYGGSKMPAERSDLFRKNFKTH